MTSEAGVAALPLDDMSDNSKITENVIRLSEEDFAGGRSSRSGARGVGRALGVEASPAVQGEGEDSKEWLPELERIIGGLEVREKPLYYRFAKRAFDIVFSSCVIVVGLVPGLVLSAFIVADTKGSPIYSSTRVGRRGRPFRILKFRSMVADADNLEKYFTPEQLDQWHREHKVDDDPRITKLGTFLRASSIDEFPQFVNVFFGQMSTVGSRAITAEETDYFGDGKDLLLSMRPGVAWDIIAPKPEAGKKVSGARILPAYEGSRTVRAVAA